MALKKKYTKKDEIPEAIRGEYEEKDGEFYLKLEDDDESEKVKEFRENNRKLQKELADKQSEFGQFKKQYEGVDLENYKKVQKQIDGMKAEEEKALLKEGKWEELVSRRVSSSLAQKDEQYNALQGAYASLEKERDVLKGNLGKHLIERSAQVEISKQNLKIRKGALKDVLSRVNDDWRIDDKGEAIPQNREGKLLYGEKGGPITWPEYVKQMMTEADHLFEPATGGGSEGSKTPVVTGGKRIIKSTDKKALGEFMHEIASGKAIVVD